MELVGEEKRIQALFSEVRLADGQTTPSFAGVWNRAQSKTIRTRRAFNLSFVAATVLLVCAWASLVWWSKQWQQNPDVVATAPKELATGPVRVGIENEEVNSPVPVPKDNSPVARSRTLKLAPRREALQVTRGLEAAHHLLAHPCWLMRVFRPVIQPLLLAVFTVQTEIPVRRSIAFELVGDQHTRRTAVLLEQLAHKALGCGLVAPTLH